MKRLFAVLKNRWITSLLGLLAVSILIWFVGPLIAIAGMVPLGSETARFIAILVCVFLWGLNNARIQSQVNKANADLVADAGEDPGAAVQPDQSVSREEVALLKNRFDDALKTLKVASRKRGGASIYELPWYIIIGPPGSGKTTALLKSGLKFPLAEKFGKNAIHGVGGTRNCDWWFTEEAVLLDTAGRYTTQDSDARADSAAWRGFLKLLKKYRRRRPINGALVAISLQDLLTQSEAERNRQVSAIRQRLQELQQELGVKFPVYMIFTKCDLVSGFMEFFDDLGLQERGQVWGVSFPFDAQQDPAGTARLFNEEFDLLVEQINRRLMWKLHHERNVDRRKRIFSFPPQMASMKELLGGFLDDVFASSRYDESPLLRGAYFISSTQEGSPIDRVMGSLARVFDVSPQSIRPFSGEGKSFFVNRLLQNVIFEEAELVGANRGIEKRRRWLQGGAYAAAAIAAVAMVLAWSTSFTRNQIYTGRFQSALDSYQDLASEQASLGGPETFDQLLDRLNTVRGITDVYRPFQDQAPMLMGFGLYQGDRLGESAMEIYRQELNQYLLPSVMFRVEQDLLSSNDDSDLQYEALKTYLMLADEDRRDPEQIALWMDLDWREMYPDQPAVQGQFAEHLRSMLELGYEPFALDDTVIASARRDLSAVPLADLLYGRMKRDYVAIDSNPFRLASATGPAGETVFDRQSGAGLAEEGITSFLTYDGYHDYFSGQLNSVALLASNEIWVLNPSREELSAAEVLDLQQGLRQRYFADYIQSWENLLSDLRISEFQSLQQAQEVLDQAAGTGSPVRNLLREVAGQLTLARSGLLDNVAAAAVNVTSQSRLARLRQSADNDNDGGDALESIVSPESVVNEHFQELITFVSANENGDSTLDLALESVDRLNEQLNAVLMGIGPDALELAAASDSTDLMTRLQVESSRYPEPVDTWMLQLAVNSRAAVFGGARAQLDDRWQSQVLPMCRQAVNNRYPFVKDSPRDITLQDFAMLFGPEGTIPGFFSEYLQQFADITANEWRWRTFGNSSIGISNQVLSQFQRAATIQEIYFQDGSRLPSVSFQLQPTYMDANVTSFELELGNQVYTYRHDPPRLRPAQWPAASDSGLVRISFEDSSGLPLTTTINGPWAWFRLLDTAEVEVRSNDLVEVTFTDRGRRSTWELHANTILNPFIMEPISQFRCPGSLL